MSMYQIEDFIETAIKAVAESELNTQQKRDLIYTLFEMESCGDCGFTNLRTIKETIACSYSFAFEAKQMYNYQTHPELYDGDSHMTYSDRDVYYDEETGKYCIDSGSKAWSEMIKIGAIGGDGAIPVEYLSYKEVLRTLKALMPNMDSYTRSGFEMLAMITFATDQMSEQEILEIMGKTQEQLEEGDDSDEFNQPAPQATYYIAGSPVTFRVIAEAEQGNNITMSGYMTDCPIMLHENTLPLTFKILLTEPACLDCGPWRELMQEMTDERLVEIMSNLAPQPQFDNYVAILNNFLQALNSSPTYISVMMEMVGVPTESSVLRIEQIDSVIQILPTGLKIDHDIRVRIDDEKLYTFHTGNISELLSE